MIKRTIEISQESLHLAVELDQLRLYRHEPQSGLASSIPCEDIGLIVVDQPAATYSHAALARLIEFGAAVVICGRNHLPSGILLPLGNHTTGVSRLRDQIRISATPQATMEANCPRQGSQSSREPGYRCAERRKLLALAHEVKSGDATNIEAQSAKIYWGAWLRAKPIVPSADTNQRIEAEFRRDPDGDDVLNVLLNYGYAILRAAVARTLVSAGLHPAIGLQHSNRSNAFCLADDLLEPLRPLVDRSVRELHLAGTTELNKAAKARLLGLLTVTMRIGGQKGPLMVGLHRVASSLVDCFQGRKRRLLLPQEGPTDG